MEDHSFAVLGDKVWQFARDNDAAGIWNLCSRGVTPHKANLAGQTPLHIGAFWGHAEAVQALLDCRADPNKKNLMRGGNFPLCCPPEVADHFRHLRKLTERGAPLHSAASGKGPPEKRAECIKLLLARGANPYEEDINGDLPMDCADDEIVMVAFGAAPLILHHAVTAKSYTALSDALTQVRVEENLIRPDRAASTLNDKNLDGETALHLAAALGWHEGIQSLLASRASVLSENKQQASPLHVAVLSGCLRSVSLLIEARVNVDALDTDIDLAGYKSQAFKEHPHAHRSPLHYAAELGNVLIANQLLDAKAEPNCKDSKLATPLHLCIIARGNKQTKLERGSGIRACGVMKKPEWSGQLGSIMGDRVLAATEMADGSSRDECLWPVMLDENANKTMLLQEGNLAQTSDEMVDLLIVARADVNLDDGWCTCLHDAARLGDSVVLRKIVSARASLNVRDSKLGLTALHLAARSKHHDVIHILVEGRVDLQVVTSSGKTAAELAKTNGASTAVLALLQESLE